MRKSQGKRRIPNWGLGLIFIVIVVVGSLLAFTKQLPWHHGYTVKAVFANAANVRTNAPVRIAGVNVGKVTGIQSLPPADTTTTSSGASNTGGGGEGATLVTMEINDEGRPIKTDATFQMRPRLFLEGNLYVDVHPGSPSAPEASDGYTFGIDRTSATVQLDQILTTLQSDVRSNLQIALEELGSAFVDHGGAAGFQEFYRTSPGAFKYTAQVENALLGTQPHDLSNLIVNLDKVVSGLGRQPAQLSDLVTNFRIFAGSFAAQDQALARGIALLPSVLQAAKPAFANLNAAFPPLRAFAREALPGVRSTPATLEVATPFVHQLGALVAPSELGGLVVDLKTAVPKLASLSKLTPSFLDQARALSSCFNQVVIPWSNDRVVPPSSYPLPVPGNVFEETAYGLVGINGESRSGDANGQYIRTEAGGGVNLVHTNLPSAGGALFGLTPFPLEGAVPSFAPNQDSLKTPFKPKQPCERQDPPNLGASLGSAPTQTTVSAPTLDALPSTLSSAYTKFTGLLNDLGKASQLKSDGQRNKATDLLDTTNAALQKLMNSYSSTVGSLYGTLGSSSDSTTSSATTGGTSTQQGG